MQQIGIADGYNSADTQLCKYLYDDFIRVASGLDGTPGVNCLNGATKGWNQTFSYDGFGNIIKSTTVLRVTWACSACYNPATNQYNNVLSPNVTYDAGGNLTNDTFHTYIWQVYDHVASIDADTVTYDAHDNKVEESVGGLIHQYVSAFGVNARMASGLLERATTVSLGNVHTITELSGRSVTYGYDKIITCNRRPLRPIRVAAMARRPIPTMPSATARRWLPPFRRCEEHKLRLRRQRSSEHRYVR